MNLKLLRDYLTLMLILLLASVLRLWQLGNVPISFSDDEIRLIYSGYSISQTGNDVYGNFLPLVFRTETASTFGQVPIYLEAIFFYFLPANNFVARLPFAISGILSVPFIYFIVKKAINNKKIAITSAFVLSVNVWNIQMTRFAIETDIALLSYLMGILIFLYSGKKIKLFLLSMLFMFLSFYTYAAYKVTLIPLIFILLWFRFKELTRKHFFIAIATIIFAFGSFWYLAITQDAASYAGVNGSAFFFQDKITTSKSVELERRASNEPNFIEMLYHNKFTYWGRVFATNYLTAFSPQYLFLNQEASGIYSIWGRGEFYIFELILALLGVFYLFVKNKKAFYFVLMLLLISPLPSAVGINTPTWSSRSSFMIPWMCILIGAGLYSLILYPKRSLYKYMILVVLGLFYLYAITGYISQYYFDWSSTNAKYFSESTKHLVSIINQYKSEGKDVIVVGAEDNILLHYAFYNKVNPRLIQAKITKMPLKLDNFTFLKGCLISSKNPFDMISKNQVYITDVYRCNYEATPSAVINNYDNTELLWTIYEK